MHSGNGSTRAIFRSHSHSAPLSIMAGTEEILVLVAVEDFIHWNNKDILRRVLIMDIEITGIVGSQSISLIGDLITIGNTCLPGIEALAVHREKNILALRPLIIGPYRIRIHLRIQSQFGKKEMNYRPGDAAIIIAFIVTMFIR